MSITRERIIELGEDLIRTRGYNAFSYQDISTELGIKNAAVHYYFPSKANLGTSIIRTNVQRFEEMVDNMHSRGFDEWQQLDTFMKIYLKSHREHKLCIVGSLGSDYYSLHETTRQELAGMTEKILAWLSQILAAGRGKKLFAFRDEAQNRATLIFTSLVAGLQLSRMMNKFDFKNICQVMQENLKP